MKNLFLIIKKINTKKYLLFIFFLIAVSCKRPESERNIKIESSTLTKKENKLFETISKKNTDLVDVKNSDHPKQSKIIKSKFDLDLLFGIWTYNPEDPHADFELSKNSFYVVDYDGNGDMPYIINHDTIKVYYNDYISIGIIKNASKDTLKIDWDKNGITNYVKWKG